MNSGPTPVEENMATFIGKNIPYQRDRVGYCSKKKTDCVTLVSFQY